MTRPARADVPMWRLALPMTLSNLTVPLVGMVDTAVVGRIGVADIGAVALGSSVFAFICWVFVFIRMGTTGFAAQAWGAGDVRELSNWAVRAFVAAAVIGVILVLLSMPLRWLALLVADPTPGVAPFADRYLAIRMWSAPAVLVNFAAVGLLLGWQRADLVLVHQLLVNVLNCGLDLWLGVHLGYGLAGVAWASVLAEWSGLVVAIGMTIALAGKHGAPLDWRAIRDTPALRRALRVNGDIFLRTVLAVSSVMLFTAVGSRMGELILAANGILFLLQTLIAYGLDGFAHAAEALVGSAVGRRDRASLRRAVLSTTRWAAVVAVLYSATFLGAGSHIVALMTDIHEVQSTVALFLPWAIVLPLVSIWGFQLDGIFIGATRTRTMLHAMSVSVAIFVVGIAALVPLFGNHGLWGAYFVFMVARAVTLGLAYPALERSIGRQEGQPRSA